jgi:hypothetical protein
MSRIFLEAIWLETRVIHQCQRSVTFFPVIANIFSFTGHRVSAESTLLFPV